MSESCKQRWLASGLRVLTRIAVMKTDRYSEGTDTRDTPYTRVLDFTNACPVLLHAKNHLFLGLFVCLFYSIAGKITCLFLSVSFAVVSLSRRPGHQGEQSRPRGRTAQVQPAPGLASRSLGSGAERPVVT